MVIHPNNHWFGAITEDAVDEILDSLEAGQVAEKYLISE
jgi:(2Fe-2S) ferredoxin